MDSTQARLAQIEGQMNALAQAWLYLAASVEMQCGADLVPMEDALTAKTWQGSPELGREARKATAWLCRELAAARAVRNARWRDRDDY
ncbi:MAG: hypothetical protein KDH15_13905 [Rhodocyclaceae bacterium]|nr:hypothetical protein [Rhodocyclaceae bacterium]